jgi:2-haloalkanoic acid dehalogenase type II
MIKAVCFDLDDTLYDYRGSMHECEKHLCQITAEVVGKPPGDCQRAYSQVKRGLYESRPADPAILDWRERISFLLARLGKIPEDYQIQGLFDEFWERFLSVIEPFPDARPALMMIRRSGRKTAILSNGMRDQQVTKIRGLGLADLFDIDVFSEDVGSNKPDPAIYRKALTDLDLTPEESLMVGDLPHVDIKGALTSGMYACWLRRGSSAHAAPRDATEEPHFTIQRLAELGPVLEAI